MYRIARKKHLVATGERQTTAMATVISKPASHPPKMKRPPPPLSGTGVSGIKPPHQASSASSSSPSSTSKRLPGTNQADAGNVTSSPMANGVNGASAYLNKGPLGRSKKDAQRPVDQAARLQRPPSRAMSLDNERRVGKKCPEPYGKAVPTRPAAPTRIGRDTRACI